MKQIYPFYTYHKWGICLCTQSRQDGCSAYNPRRMYDLQGMKGRLIRNGLGDVTWHYEWYDNGYLKKGKQLKRKGDQ